MVVSNLSVIRGGLLLVAALLPLTATAQATPNLPPDVAQQMEKLSASGGPLQGGMARLNRMTDPDAGKRPGDEKLTCAQIKAQFDVTREKHAVQSARQDAARAAVEDDARQAQAEAAGPGSVFKGLLGGLGAVAAHGIGAGDAFNEKLKADAVATQTRRQDLQNRFAEEAEATKALSDRGRVLMGLGSTKGCPALEVKP